MIMLDTSSNKLIIDSNNYTKEYLENNYILLYNYFKNLLKNKNNKKLFLEKIDINILELYGFKSSIRIYNNNDIDNNLIINDSASSNNNKNVFFYIKNSDNNIINHELMLHNNYNSYYSVQVLLFKIKDEDNKYLKLNKDINFIFNNKNYNIFQENDIFFIVPNYPLIYNYFNINNINLNSKLPICKIKYV